MITVGINEGHNSTACVFKDGQIMAAISEERITRQKTESGFPTKAIEKCLEIAGVSIEDVDNVAISTHHLPATYMITKRNTHFSIKDYVREQKEYWRPKLFENKDVDYLSLFSEHDYRDELPYDFSKLKDFNDIAAFTEIRMENARKFFNLPPEKIVIYDHHLCHAAYAYYASPFRKKDVLVITADGGGDYTSGTVNCVKNGKLEVIHRCKNNNIGRMYRYTTLILGMKLSEHEYKVMGMAPYAKDEIMAEPYAIYAETLQNDGLDFKYKVKPKGNFFHFKEQFDSCRFDGISKAIQTRTEELITTWIKNALDHTGLKNLVYSGGVAMNVKVNKRLGEMEEIEEFFVPPSGGDESTAIGAAYLTLAETLDETEIHHISSAYLGHEFDNNDVMEALKKVNASKTCIIKENATSKELAEILSKGGIIARLAGRMEFGARALGNRSIIANPKDFDVVRVINEMIKRRDFWMPFTPSILKEREHDYLINPKGYASPFMAIGFDSTELAREELKAAIHPYDFTVRPQLVEKEINPQYWELIKEFEKITGVGAVLNTSFNLHGEPIVASPGDALKTFFESGLDNLLLNNILVQKK